MNKKAESFLRSLLATPTPTGNEQEGQSLMAEYMKQHADEVRFDSHGNVHGVLNPSAPYRVMLAGHCDEIGLMIQFIDKEGFLYVSALGGVHVPLLPGERVLFKGRKGPVPGVVGVKPIHLMTPQEREKVTNQIHELWIDIGARNKADAEKLVEIGNVGTINTGWVSLQNGRVACRGMDDRIGAFAIADALRLLKDKPLNVAVHAVSTVQEEVGLRGARTAAYSVDPHVGIAVDVGFATDFPEINPKIVGEAHLGKGPILHSGPTYNNAVLKALRKAARASKIKTQLQPEARGTGTDAFALQMTRAGVPTALLSIPSRYMHSPVETIALRDAEHTSKLIAAFVETLSGKETWT